VNLSTRYLIALVCLAIALPFGAIAQHSHAPPNGQKYLDVPQPQLPLTNSGKIEVIEFFSYGCGHCATFQPYVDAWLKRVDTNKVELVYIPATFRPDFALLARGYYAADSLGAAKTTHHGVFNTIFNGTTPQIRTFNDVVAIYERLGIKREDFIAAAQKFDVETKLRTAGQLLETFRIEGTPEIIVAGKYRVTGESAGGNDKVFAVVDALIAKELAAKKTAADK
jgi:thiol:disulfide interchange protein DsbA